MAEKRKTRGISIFITFLIVFCTIIGIIPTDMARAATIYGFVPENFWWDIDSEGNAVIMGVNLGTTKGDIKIPTTLAGGQGPYYIASGTTSPGGSYVGISGKTYKVTKIHGGYGMYASGGYYTEFGAFSPLSPVNAGNCYANNITGVQFPAQGTIISTDATNLFQAGDSSASASRQSSLTKVTNFPDSYTNLTSAFENCTKLVTGPELGANVTTVTNAFKNCTSLKKLVVYSRSVDMASAFPGCSDINLYCYKDSAADKAVTGVSERTYFGEIYTNPPAVIEASVGDSVTAQAQYISDKTNRLTKSVAATWQVNNDGVWEDIDTNVSDTTSSHIGTAVLTIPNVTLEDNGKQFRLYSTDGGSVSEYSNIVTLQIEYGSLATDFVWEFDDTAKTAKVIGYIGNGGTVIVPSSVTGTGETYGGGYTLGTAGITYTVTDIAAHWSYSPDIKSVYLPDTLTSTSAERWFEMMTGLQEVNNLPDTLENMAYTFSGCTSLIIPPEIPDSVSDMTYTFMGCENLAEISNIPASISNMSGCYMDCNALTSLPEILDIAVNMDNTFQNTGITEAPVIGAKVKSFHGIFDGCVGLNGKTAVFLSMNDGDFNVAGAKVICYSDSKLAQNINTEQLYGTCELAEVSYFGEITSEPQDVLFTGEVVSFTAGVLSDSSYGGSRISSQWQCSTDNFVNDTVNLTEGVSIERVDITDYVTLTFTPAEDDVAKSYRLYVDGGGISNIVKILTIPVIESTSELEKTVEAKNMFSNTVNAMYATSYKWERLSENGTWTDMRINNETMWYAEQNEGTYQYRCTVTGTGGSVISEIFVVHVEDNSKQISVVVPTKVVFDIDPNIDGAGYTDAATGFFSNTGGCDVELSVADISGQNGAPITAYNKYSREAWQNLGRAETERNLGFLFRAGGNTVGYIPGQSLPLGELPEGSDKDVSYIVAHGNAWTEPKAFVYDIIYSVSVIS